MTAPGPDHPADVPPPHQQLVRPTVLVGLDGTETSWNAFWWACGEARRSEGCLIGVFVSSDRPARVAQTVSAMAGLPYDFSAVESVEAEEAAGMEEELRRYGREQNLEVRFVHAHGDPATELVRLACSERADLIVVGKSTSVVHHLTGSVGKRLMSDRDSPVVVVVP